jgi:dynein heavy chain
VDSGVVAANCRCRYPVPDDDFESARKAYEWPKRFAEVLREAGTKAASEHRQFEAALKARRKDFEKQVEQCASDLTAVEARSDIIKRVVVATEVCEMYHSGLC